jgi:hypothetical protein
MVCIGIDPGPELSAYACLEGKIIRGWGKVPNPDLLLLIPGWQNAVLTLEGLQCYGMPVGESTFQTAIWLGRFIQKAVECHINWQVVKRSDVKYYLCGAKAKLKDKDVREALVQKYGLPGTKKEPGPTYGISGDGWSALALADYGQFLVSHMLK